MKAKIVRVGTDVVDAAAFIARHESYPEGRAFALVTRASILAHARALGWNPAKVTNSPEKAP